MIKGSRLLVLAAVLVNGIGATSAMATPSCTEWMDQGDGTSWKECVNDDGSQHCYTINNTAGSTASEVSCSN